MKRLPMVATERLGRLGRCLSSAIVLAACSSSPPAEPSADGAAAARAPAPPTGQVATSDAGVASGRSAAGDAPPASPRPVFADPEAARRFARAIASDILLYNEESVRSLRASGVMPEKLASEIEEGRALYRQRVAPEHYGLFQPAIDQIIFLKHAGP